MHKAAPPLPAANHDAHYKLHRTGRKYSVARDYRRWQPSIQPSLMWIKSSAGKPL